MSERKRTRRRKTGSETVVPPLTAEVQELFRKLMDDCTMLVIKVATCRCKEKDSCPVYSKSQEIADVIDKLQELRVKGELGIPARPSETETGVA